MRIWIRVMAVAIWIGALFGCAATTKEGGTGDTILIFPLRFQQAADGARIVRDLWTLKVSYLERTNAVILRGKKEDVAEAEKMLVDLEKGWIIEDDMVYIYYMKRAKATEVAATLREVFGKDGRMDGIRERKDRLISIGVNDRLNMLVVASSPGLEMQIADLIKKLDQEVPPEGWWK